MRRQSVLGMHPLADAKLGAGKIPITEENWNKTFHVPLVATTDSIPDGGISDVALGFRLKAGLRFHNITRVPVSTICRVDHKNYHTHGWSFVFWLRIGSIDI